MIHPTTKLSDYACVEDAVADLFAPFINGAPAPRCVPTRPEAMPTVFRELLVHHEHMTAMLRAHFGAPVELDVLNYEQEGHAYRRRILLHVAGGGQPVEFGIVRIDLRHLPDEASREIVDRDRPLGEILIRHDVLRRIEPRWFLHFPDGVCEPRVPVIDGGFFGRVGTIYCDGEPAIELLEVVTRV